MNLALEKIIAIIIFLIVLVVLLIFVGIPKVFGGQVNKQLDLSRCCQAFIARGCPIDRVPNDILCGNETMDQLVVDVGLIDAGGNPDVNQTIRFCNCPNKTFPGT